MPPLCADNNNNLIRHHSSISSSSSSMSSAPRPEPSSSSLLAIAQHLVQQQQGKHPLLPSDIHPAELCAPWPSARSEDTSALHPLHHHHHKQQQQSLGFSAAMSSGSDGDGGGELAAFLLRGGGGGAAEMDMPAADWILMDCLMYDMDAEAAAIASCFDANNPCESSTQSSEPAAMTAAAASSTGYPCTPLEEALPDGFTVLEEAQRCILQQQEEAWKHKHHYDNCLEQKQDMVVVEHVLHAEGEGAIQAATSADEAGVGVPSQGIHLMQLLLECAKAVEREPDRAKDLVSLLKYKASKNGDPIQRLSAYFADGLGRRLCHDATGEEGAVVAEQQQQERLMAHKAMRDTCPFDAFAELTVNQAILECTAAAAASSTPCRRLHIVDFCVGYGVQWAALLQSMSHSSSLAHTPVHITGVQMPGSPPLPPLLSSWLSEFGLSAGINASFRSAQANIDSIAVQDDDLVVVNLMHSISVAMEGRGDEGVEELLGLVAEMDPTLVMVAETELTVAASSSFKERFLAALHFYSAMFDVTEAAMGRESEKRAMVEGVILGKGIEAAVLGGSSLHGCSGGGGSSAGGSARWRRRRWFRRAGFAPRQLSGYARSQAQILLWRFAEGFGLVDDVEADVEDDMEGTSVTLAWQSRPLLSVSAWHPNHALRTGLETNHHN